MTIKYRRVSSCSLLICMLCVLPLNGCGFHLYNATDDNRAKSAGDAFKATDVTKIITDERAVLQASMLSDSWKIFTHASLQLAFPRTSRCKSRCRTCRTCSAKR